MLPFRFSFIFVTYGSIVFFAGLLHRSSNSHPMSLCHCFIVNILVITEIVVTCGAVLTLLKLYGVLADAGVEPVFSYYQKTWCKYDFVHLFRYVLLVVSYKTIILYCFVHAVLNLFCPFFGRSLLEIQLSRVLRVQSFVDDIV